MKDHRHGDQLWVEWSGDGLDSATDLQYYTMGHVSLDEDVVRRALASTIQRDGIADSLADGFRLLDGVWISQEWAGFLRDESDLIICDEQGETHYGDFVEVSLPVTIVHIVL